MQRLKWIGWDSANLRINTALIRARSGDIEGAIVPENLADAFRAVPEYTALANAAAWDHSTGNLVS